MAASIFSRSWAFRISSLPWSVRGMALNRAANPLPGATAGFYQSLQKFCRVTVSRDGQSAGRVLIRTGSSSRLYCPELCEAFDVRAHGGELFDDAFVAAIDVIDAVDHGFAGSDERGQHQAGAGTQIGGLHDRAGKRSWGRERRRGVHRS